MTDYVVDAFTGTNGTAIPSHSPDTDVQGGGWALQPLRTSLAPATSGSVQIQSNEYQITTSFNGCVIDLGVADFVADVDWIIGGTSGQRCDIVGNWSTTGDHNRFNIREPNDDVQYYELVGDVQTQVGSTVATTFNTGTTYAMRVRFAGTKKTLFKDFAQLLQVTSTANSSGTKMGLFASSIGTNARFDNLRVWDGINQVDTSTGGSGGATQSATQRAASGRTEDASGDVTQTALGRFAVNGTSVYGSGSADQSIATVTPASIDAAAAGADSRIIIVRVSVFAVEGSTGAAAVDGTVAGDLNVTVATPATGGALQDGSLAGDLNVDVLTAGGGAAVQSVAAQFVIESMQPATGTDSITLRGDFAGAVAETGGAAGAQSVMMGAFMSLAGAAIGGESGTGSVVMPAGVAVGASGGASLSVAQRAALTATETAVAAVFQSLTVRSGINVSDGAIGAVTVGAVLDSERFELVGDVYLRNRSVVYRVRSIRRRR